MWECCGRTECFLRVDIRRENNTKITAVWVVTQAQRQTPHSGGSKVIFLYSFYVSGLWMSHKEAAAAADAVPVRLLEHTWPPFTSEARHLDKVLEQQLGIETSMVIMLMCTQAWGPQPAKSYFSHFLVVSQSPSWDGGHLLTITKTETLNCVSHPEGKVGSEPWRPEVPWGIWASSFPPCVKNVAGSQMRQRKQTKLANLLPKP